MRRLIMHCKHMLKWIFLICSSLSIPAFSGGIAVAGADDVITLSGAEKTSDIPKGHQAIDVAVLGTVAEEPLDVKRFTLERAIDIALRDNPGLAEMQARAEAMAAIPSQAGTLPDPMLSFNRSEERRVGKEGRSRWSPY